VAEAVANAARRTTSRSELAQHQGFAEVSPELGVLDDDAFDQLLAEDPNHAMGLLADLVGATDPVLRRLAARLAGRVTTDLARSGPAPRPGRGVGRLARRRASVADGDLDLDASMDAILTSRATGAAAPPDELTVAAWERPGTALCLVVDRSGSMLGSRLATAAVIASTVVLSRPTDASVLAIAREALVVRPQGSSRSAEQVVDDLLVLRGHGVTDLSLALDAAAHQLARSDARRKVCLVLSDCRSTAGPEPTATARLFEELVLLPPKDDVADATALAEATGALLIPVAGPTDAPAVIRAALA
jgi:Mg-chelatase subunit ChlD